MINEKPINVTFLIDKDNTTIFAYFPRTNYSKVLYQNRVKVAYSNIGQHSSCAVAYAKECKPAKPNEYKELKKELENIGYNLKLSNKNLDISL